MLLISWFIAIVYVLGIGIEIFQEDNKQSFGQKFFVLLVAGCVLAQSIYVIRSF